MVGQRTLDPFILVRIQARQHMFWTLIALIASVLTAIQLLPQTLRAIRTRDLKSISLITFFTISFTAFLWVLHGVHNKDNAIIFANTITFLCAITITSLKLLRK